MIILGLRSVRGGRLPTVAAVIGGVGVALAGAVVWGLVALLFHVQLSVLGVLIGVGVGATVARFRPAHRPTIIAGAVLAVAGCAFGTLLGEVFYLLRHHVGVSAILGHLNLLLRSYPRNVGVLGLVFYAVAAVAAIRLPWRGPAAAGTPVPAAEDIAEASAAPGPDEEAAATSMDAAATSMDAAATSAETGVSRPGSGQTG